MSGVFFSAAGKLPIQIAQYVRNGKTPSAMLQSAIAEGLGFSAQLRTKLLFARSVPIDNIPASAGSTRKRWRFAWRTGPFCKTLAVHMELAPQDNGTPTTPYGKLEIATSSGTVVGIAKVSWGSSNGSFDDLPINFGGGIVTLVDPADGVSPVTLSPNTEYRALVFDQDYARIMSCTVWEISLDPDTDNGYAPTGIADGTPINDIDRSVPATMLHDLWKKGAQQLISWCSETDTTAPTSGPGDLSGVLSASIGAITASMAGTVSSSPPAWQDTGDIQSSTSSDVVTTWPAHATNDVGVLVAVARKVGSAPTIDTPTGGTWTAVTTTTATTGSGESAVYVRLATFWQRASSGSMTDGTVKYPSGADWCDAFIITARGCVTSGSPVAHENASADSTSTLTAVGMTTSLDNLLLFAFGVSDDGGGLTSWANASTTGVTAREDTGSYAVATGTLLTAASPINSTTASYGGSVDWGGSHVILKP